MLDVCYLILCCLAIHPLCLSNLSLTTPPATWRLQCSVMLVTIAVSSLLASVLAEEKHWQWSNSFQEENHWEQGRLPCPGQPVIIPDDVVFLSTEVSLGELELGVG